MKSRARTQSSHRSAGIGVETRVYTGMTAYQPLQRRGDVPEAVHLESTGQSEGVREDLLVRCEHYEYNGGAKWR